MIILCVMTLPWAVYSIVTQRWGFVALTALWATVYVSNAVTWKKQSSGNEGLPAMSDFTKDEG